MEEAKPGVIRKLDENFFRVRFDRLTPSEKKYLRAMAELGGALSLGGCGCHIEGFCAICGTR